MRALERFLLLQIIDERWREHLYDMDYLREGIHLRGFAQIEPIVAYKNEAFTLFTDMMNGDLVDVRAHGLQRRGRGRGRPGWTPQAGAAGRRRRRRSSSTRAGRVERTGYCGEEGVVADGEGERAGVGAPVQQRVLDENEQLGRNDPCWCGSGKKFKKCHGA